MLLCPLAPLFSTFTPCFSQTVYLLLATFWCLLMFRLSLLLLLSMHASYGFFPNSVSPTTTSLPVTAEFSSLTPTPVSDLQNSFFFYPFTGPVLLRVLSLDCSSGL